MKRRPTYLIAVDTSAFAKTILAKAKQILPQDANIYLVTVVDSPTTLGLGAIDDARIIEKDHKEAQIYLHALVEEFDLTSYFASVHAEVYDGNPGITIAEVLPFKYEVDAIVIGKTSKGHLMDKIFVGSTARRIMDMTNYSVILIK